MKATIDQNRRSDGSGVFRGRTDIVTAGDSDTEITNQGAQLNAQSSSGSDNARESNVDSTQTRQGKSPNKAQAPQKPSGAPAKKQSAEGEPSGLAELMQFLQESYVEFRKISWPTREQVIQETWSVIVLVAVFTCAVLAFDWAIAKVVFEPLDKFAKQSGGGVGHTTQSWGPLSAPPLPINQPGAPGNQPATPQSSPQGKLNPGSQPGSQPAPSGQPAPAGQPGGAKQ